MFGLVMLINNSNIIQLWCLGVTYGTLTFLASAKNVILIVATKIYNVTDAYNCISLFLERSEYGQKYKMSAIYWTIK